MGEPGATQRLRPISPSSLVELLTGMALRAVQIRTPQAVSTAGSPATSPLWGPRLGIDAAVELDGAPLADHLAAALMASGVPVARVRAADFLRARSLRLEFGTADGEVLLDGWYDAAALRREVLDPLGPGGDGRWLPRLRHPLTDRAYRDPRSAALPGTVTVLDGRFLGRTPLREGLDLLVHLDTSAAALARRLPPDAPAGIAAAWARYLHEDDPAGTADVVVRADHPHRPAVVVRS